MPTSTTGVERLEASVCVGNTGGGGTGDAAAQAWR